MPAAGQTRTSSLGAARPLPPSADIGPGGQSVGQAAQFCLGPKNPNAIYECVTLFYNPRCLSLSSFLIGLLRPRHPTLVCISRTLARNNKTPMPVLRYLHDNDNLLRRIKDDEKHDETTCDLGRQPP